MKRVEAKILENEPEDPGTEPDREPNTWLIQGKLSEDVLDWENVRLDFQSSEIEAEIIESSLSDPSRLTIQTSGRSPLKKGFSTHRYSIAEGLTFVIPVVTASKAGAYHRNKPKRYDG